MFAWIIENIATIAVGGVLALVLGLIVYKMIKDKRSGKSGCGCGCEHFALADKCHPKK